MVIVNDYNADEMNFNVNSLVEGEVNVLGSSLGPNGGSRARQIITSDPSPSQ